MFLFLLQTADWLDSLVPKLGEIWDWDSFMNAGPLTCVTHSDSWSNNLLFKYPASDSHKPLDMVLIDWQLARLGHPAHDLGYFLFSGTSSSFRREHLNGLWIDYFTTLKSALAKLGINLEEEGYDQARFMREVKERNVLMLFIALFILPILLDASKAMDHTLKDKETSSGQEAENDGTCFVFCVGLLADALR